MKEIFLYIILSPGSWGTSVYENRYQMPDMQTCLKSLEAGKFQAEKEGAVAAFCGNEHMQRLLRYNDGKIKWVSKGMKGYK